MALVCRIIAFHKTTFLRRINFTVVPDGWETSTFEMIVKRSREITKAVAILTTANGGVILNPEDDQQLVLTIAQDSIVPGIYVQDLYRYDLASVRWPVWSGVLEMRRGA